MPSDNLPLCIVYPYLTSTATAT